MSISLYTIAFILFLSIFVIGLQIFLSRLHNKWAGLLLPFLAFCNSLIYLFNVAVIESLWQTVFLLAVTFLISNIPTALLLGIYFLCRQRIKKLREIDKMNIQDL